MTKSRAFAIVLLLFVLSVLLRLPNLNRIVSKHHEFNTAMVLINTESWRQAGGGSAFHFIPLINFQNPGDKRPNKTHYSVDPNGNQMYVSSGPAWIIIPYFIYEIFGLPNVPIYIQIINLIFNLASVILFFKLLELLISPDKKDKYPLVIFSCFFFMYSPCTLWYFGNGYVNIDIQIPFIISFFLLILPMLQSAQNITSKKLFFLSLLTLSLVYFDWLILAICFIIGVYLLFRIKKQPKYFRVIFSLGISSVAGVVLLFAQFTSYAGWQKIVTYWSQRFGTRSFTNSGGDAFLQLTRYLIQNFITAYLPLLIFLVGMFIWVITKKIKIAFTNTEKIFLGLYSTSIILYNFTLFEWSSDHEYSILPWSILFSYLAIKFIPIFSKRQLYVLIIIFFIATISQYYFINRPGKISREGTPYMSFKNFGDSLKQVPVNYQIFTDLKQDPMVEYYGGRNITTIENLDSAKAYMKKWNVTKAVWVEHDNLDFKKAFIISVN